VASAIRLSDHCTFEVARTAALNRAEEFNAVRYRVTSEVAGRRFEQFPVDVALSENPTAPAEHLSIPNLLAFAEIATPHAGRLHNSLTATFHWSNARPRRTKPRRFGLPPEGDCTGTVPGSSRLW